MNLYCADSGSKRISTAQTLAPNESLLLRLLLQTNLYCADSGSKWISTLQTLAPNESLLRRLWLQMNLYSADSGSKRISTAQTLAPNESLLRRLWLQTNLYCADSGSKQISTAQTPAPNKSLLFRLWLQTNLYCADSGSKQISTAHTRASKQIILLRLGPPNYVIYSRWQQSYWDVFASLFYSGRKRRCIVHLFYSLWSTLDAIMSHRATSSVDSITDYNGFNTIFWCIRYSTVLPNISSLLTHNGACVPWHLSIVHASL